MKKNNTLRCLSISAVLLLGSSLTAEASTINKSTNPFNDYQKNAEIQKKLTF